MMLSPRRALVWSFAERYASFVISVGGTLVLSRLLTPTQVGIYSLCAAFAAVAGIVRDFGVSEYLIQERELTRERLRSAFGIALSVAWALAAALYFSRDALAGYFNEPGVAQVLAVMTLHFIILPLSSPAFALLNREMGFRQLAYLQTACSLTAAAVTLTLAWRGHGFMSLAWGPIANVTLQTLVLAWLRPRDVFRWPSLAQAGPVLRYGWMYMSSRVMETLAKNFHEPVIAKRLDFEAVGLFSRAYGMVELFHSNVADAVVRVSTPAFAAEHRAGRPLGDVFARATALFVSVSWPFFGFIALCSEEIIRVMFGPQWVAAAPIATVLALSALPGGLHELVPQMLSATGHVHRRLRLSAWVAPCHIIGVLVASHWGLLAIASVSFFSSLVMLVLCRQHLHAALGMHYRQLLRPSLASAWLATGVIAAMAGWLWCARTWELPALAVLVSTLAVGCALWCGLGRWLRHPAYAEAGAAVRGIMVKARSMGAA